MTPMLTRQSSAYWLALAFHLKSEKMTAKNGLVLIAHRNHGLDLLDLVQMDTAALPTDVQRFADTHARLLEAEGRVSAQAFVVDQLLQAGGGLLPITHPQYPKHLAQSLDPRKAPTLLSVIGNTDLLNCPGVAISGSRKAGASGLRFARVLGRTLAEHGVTVVSGLARGIDTEAMEGALEAGGNVIGVAAEGILKSRSIRHPQIEAGNLVVVSQFAPTAPWSGWRAMKRNQIIAGLSSALCIADCVAMGGTTAQFEVHRDLGFPVFIRRGRGEGVLMAELAQRPGAIEFPWSSGPITLPESIGGHPLPEVQCILEHQVPRIRITLDAAPDTSLDVILDAVRDAFQKTQSSATVQVSPSASVRASLNPEDTVYSALKDSPMTLNMLVEQTGVSKSTLRKRLTSLKEAKLIVVSKSGRENLYTRQDSDKHSFKEEVLALPLLASKAS